MGVNDLVKQLEKQLDRKLEAAEGGDGPRISDDPEAFHPTPGPQNVGDVELRPLPTPSTPPRRDPRRHTYQYAAEDAIREAHLDAIMTEDVTLVAASLNEAMIEDPVRPGDVLTVPLTSL